MTKKILDFSAVPVALRVERHQLKVWNGNILAASIPVEDIGCVLLAHPSIVVSLATVQDFIKENVPTIFCDSRSLPIGICYSAFTHTECASLHQLQAREYSSKPLHNRVWRQIVRAKIRAQAALLKLVRQDDGGLLALCEEVKRGDELNREATAARRYWRLLFEGRGFKRDQEGTDPINAALNYGYALVRAIVARAIVSVGLTPTLGTFHHNKYNPYALADDLMEPLRPVVDVCVYRLDQENALKDGLTVSVKNRLQCQLLGRYRINGARRNLFETTVQIAESYVKVLRKQLKELDFPVDMPLEPVEFCDPFVWKTLENPETEKEEKKPPF